jgi:hypothetical protein
LLEADDILLNFLSGHRRSHRLFLTCKIRSVTHTTTRLRKLSQQRVITSCVTLLLRQSLKLTSTLSSQGIQIHSESLLLAGQSVLHILQTAGVQERTVLVDALIMIKLYFPVYFFRHLVFGPHFVTGCFIMTLAWRFVHIRLFHSRNLYLVTALIRVR